MEEEYLNSNTLNRQLKSLKDILKNVQNHISSANIIWKDENGENTEVKQTMEWRASMSAELHLRKPIHRVLQALLA
jgi:hypothetical protein